MGEKKRAPLHPGPHNRTNRTKVYWGWANSLVILLASEHQVTPPPSHMFPERFGNLIKPSDLIDAADMCTSGDVRLER